MILPQSLRSSLCLCLASCHPPLVLLLHPVLEHTVTMDHHTLVAAVLVLPFGVPDTWPTAPTLMHLVAPEALVLMPCIDEMPKSQIEKRKRNVESTSRVLRREKRNVEICFLIREENENFCKQNGEILNIFSSFEMRREIQKYFL